jgi:hypothetical protein
MNQLYSEDDWFGFYYRSREYYPGRIDGSMKRYYLTSIRADLNVKLLNVKLQIVQKSYQSSRLNQLDWSNYSLTALRQLYLESAEAAVAEEQAKKQRIMNQLQGQLRALLQSNPQYAHEMASLVELFQSPHPDPVIIMNELHRLLEADPSTQAIAHQLGHLTSQCIIS